MSKKNKRAVISQETLERARAELREGATPVTAASVTAQTKHVGGAVTPQAAAKTARPAATVTRRVPTIEELTRQYAYVNRDLRQLAILAVSLMAVIVVAALVLTRLG